MVASALVPRLPAEAHRAAVKEAAEAICGLMSPSVAADIVVEAYLDFERRYLAAEERLRRQGSLDLWGHTGAHVYVPPEDALRHMEGPL